MVITKQIYRSVIYYSAADKQPIGHTLLEVKEKYKAELKAQEEFEGATSNSSSNNDDNNKDKGGNNINARVGLGKLVVVLNWPQRL